MAAPVGTRGVACSAECTTVSIIEQALVATGVIGLQRTPTGDASRLAKVIGEVFIASLAPAGGDSLNQGDELPELFLKRGDMIGAHACLERERAREYIIFNKSQMPFPLSRLRKWNL